jgi:hypothetical protein
MDRFNQHPHVRADVAHVEMNGEARIGLALAVVGLLAFGGYTAFFLAGFIGDLVG